MFRFTPLYLLAGAVSLTACQSREKKVSSKDSVLATTADTANRMILIPGGTFIMGASDVDARQDEQPRHSVTLDTFWIDEHEVTNAEFARFVEATGYVTTAEKPISKEELMQQMPPGSPEPDSSMLLPGALVFTPPNHAVPLDDISQWWTFTLGASWKHPQGPGSEISGKENLPVVQVSWNDAQAYARWAGKRLPTEAEWEFAARGGLNDQLYTWGSEPITSGQPKANTWSGNFPYQNTGVDGFTGLAPVRSFPANGYGLYDMAGNAWEWVADWYDADYYKHADHTHNPKGPGTGNDPDDPAVAKHTIRGGSFMCTDQYCTGYRVTARMKSSPESGLENLGFRCVR